MTETCATRPSPIAHLPGVLRAVATATRALLGDRAVSGADEGRREQESEWIRAARRGDRDAFRRLVDRHRDRAFETALRIVRRREEAEEATQDAFVRAWRALPGFREDARFSTWLYRIVTHRAIDAAEALRRRQTREISAEPELMENRPAPSASTLPEPLLRRLERILGDLEPVPRAVVTLFYLRDCSVNEVAEILDLPEGTVKTHLYRSRRTLRSAWVRCERQEERS